MLVLTRKCQESVVVGGPGAENHILTVTVLEISGRSVRLGFEAKLHVLVNRREVSEQIRAVAGAARTGSIAAAPVA